MEIKEEKTIDMLTKDTVSILTKKLIEVDGVDQQVGENHRRAYVNSEKGRAELQETEPANVVDAVLSIWGDTPTVPDPVPADPERG